MSQAKVADKQPLFRSGIFSKVKQFSEMKSDRVFTHYQ
jgi:hypothetical protein